MRFFRAISLAAIFLMPTSLSAQPMGKRTMELSINPLTLLSGGVMVNYRIRLSDNIALGIHGDMVFVPTALIGMTKNLGFGFRLSSKFFLSGDTFTDSWYIEPSFGTTFLKTKFGNSPVVNFWQLAPTLLIGYNWVWQKGFSLNFGLGASYKFVVPEKRISPNGKYDRWFKGFWPAGELSMGWAW